MRSCKGGDSFPEELSAQKADCDWQCREKYPSQRRKGRAVLGSCQMKRMQEGRLVCNSPE